MSANLLTEHGVCGQQVTVFARKYFLVLFYDIAVVLFMTYLLHFFVMNIKNIEGRVDG